MFQSWMVEVEQHPLRRHFPNGRGIQRRNRCVPRRSLSAQEEGLRSINVWRRLDDLLAISTPLLKAAEDRRTPRTQA